MGCGAGVSTLVGGDGERPPSFIARSSLFLLPLPCLCLLLPLIFSFIFSLRCPRLLFRVTVPPEPWTESVDDYEAATWVNDHHNVDVLCKEMPQRMHDLVYVTRGARLDK